MKNILLLFICLSLVGYSQDNTVDSYDHIRDGLSFRLGVNLVDSTGEWGPFNTISTPEEMAFSRPLDFGIEYRFNDLFAFGADVSLNRWKAGEGVIDSNVVQRNLDFSAFDLKLKLFLDEAFGIFEGWQWLDLYADGGLGTYRITNGDQTANLGFGISAWLTNRIGLYADGTAKWSLSGFTTPESNHFQYAAGVIVNLGNVGKQRDRCCQNNQPAFDTVDTDGDGVSDLYDRCPEVKGLAAKDGCPDVDTDEDGILDSKDRCPYLPAPGTPDGCPNPDIDNDGVLNTADKCPNVHGLMSNNGCPGEPKPTIIIPISNVYFDVNKSNIKPQYLKTLNDNSEIMKSSPDRKFNIVGHTDNSGTETYNQKLSENRANAVRDYLIRRGVSAENLIIEYRSYSDPASSNNTQQGRALNRRVSIEPIN